jgi:hypothetical protein
VAKGKRVLKYLAHVGIAGGEIAEVVVYATDRWDASDQVYKRLGMDGAADVRIKSFRMDEVKDETADHVPEVPVRDKSKDKRYRVRLYPSPASRDMKSMTMRTSSADQALWSLMGMHKVQRQDHLGPYIVEENRNGEWVTVKFNQIHNFTDRGPIAREGDKYDPAPRQTIIASAEAEEPVIGADNIDAEWDAMWAKAGFPGVREPVLNTTRVDNFVNKVNDIFLNEKKVRRPKVTLVRR